MDVGARGRSYAALLGWVLGLGVLGALAYAGTDDPRIAHSSALDAIFDARWLVAAARLLVGVAVLYVLVSIGVRVGKGQWVRSAGSLETDASPAQAFADSQEDLQQQLAAAKTTIDDLTTRLDRSLAERSDLLASMGEPQDGGRRAVPEQASESRS